MPYLVLNFQMKNGMLLLELYEFIFQPLSREQKSCTYSRIADHRYYCADTTAMVQNSKKSENREIYVWPSNTTNQNFSQNPNKSNDFAQCQCTNDIPGINYLTEFTNGTSVQNFDQYKMQVQNFDQYKMQVQNFDQQKVQAQNVSPNWENSLYNTPYPYSSAYGSPYNYEYRQNSSVQYPNVTPGHGRNSKINWM